ncbi:MAG TPA: hypothetical protein VE197_05625, partial [Mycobacterium sp.]|nr:hypothetical protein [Mycobacterium sp.]
ATSTAADYAVANRYADATTTYAVGANPENTPEVLLSCAGTKLVVGCVHHGCNALRRGFICEEQAKARCCEASTARMTFNMCQIRLTIPDHPRQSGR